MKPHRRAILAAFATFPLLLAHQPVRASGGSFPDALFSSRLKLLLTTPLPGIGAVIDLPPLKRLPDGTFAPTGFVTFDPNAKEGDYASETEKAERAGSTAQEFALIARMRSAPDAAAAAAFGAALPPDLRLYTQGAVAYAHKQHEIARAAFSQLAALPPDQSQRRAAWAEFMLGRMDTEDGQTQSGIVHFQAVRARIQNGAADGLKLGTVSLGEEARLELRRGHFAAAFALYKTQSDQGLPDANSFAYLAVKAAASPQTLNASLADPGLRMLLIRFAAIQAAPSYLYVADSGATAYGSGNSPFARILQAVAAAPRPQDPAGLLAEIAYAAAQYSVAATYAARADAPLSFWVQAKLAIHDGNLQHAAALFAQALRTGQGRPLQNEISLEAGVLSVTQADFAQAMPAIWDAVSKEAPADSSNTIEPPSATLADAFYLADRILKLDELKAFVDAHIQAVPWKGNPTTPDDYYGSNPPNNSLRDLLARRLVRAGRIDEALPYFTLPSVTAKLAAYRGERALAAQSTGIDKAEHAWRAAKLLRFSGMEFTGTEEWPDFHESGGAFDAPSPYVVNQDEDFPKKLPKDATSQEAERLLESAPSPDKRFHYRYNAVQIMQDAASALPPKSQAYAAILCEAVNWMFSSHEDATAHTIWRSYIHAGAYIPSLRIFGHGCPQPDFAAARRTYARVFRIALHDWLHRWKYPLLAFLALGAGILLLRRRAAASG